MFLFGTACLLDAGESGSDPDSTESLTPEYERFASESDTLTLSEGGWGAASPVSAVLYL